MTARRSPAWDDTLLTVDFNLRKRNNEHVLQSPAGTTLCSSIQVSSLRDLGACIARSVRRLKPTVNKVSSLQDFSPLTIPLQVVNFSCLIKKKLIFLKKMHVLFFFIKLFF